MSNGRQRVLWAVVALAGMTSLTACESSTTGPASEVTPAAVEDAATSGPAPSTVTIADLNYTAPFAARYAAMGIGAFAAVDKEFHTTIKFVEFGTAIDTLNAMLGGSADMSMAALESFLEVEAAGKHVVATVAPFIGGGGVLIGAKRWQKSRGTDLSKFAGGTFGYTREGSASELYEEVAADKAGLNWAKLPHVAFGEPSAALPLLQTGRLDVAATDPTTAAQLIDSGSAYLINNLNDPKTAGPIIGQQLGTVYGFNQSFVTKYPQLAKAVTDAFVKGIQAVKKVANDPAKVLALFPSAIQKVLAPGWAQSWPLSAPGVEATTGSMPKQAVTDTIKIAELGKQITPAVAATASKVVDNAFVPGA